MYSSNVKIICFLTFGQFFLKCTLLMILTEKIFLLKPVQKFINHSFPMQPFFTHCGVEKGYEQRVEKGCVGNHWK